MEIPFGNLGEVTDNDIKARLRVSAFDQKLVRGTSHVFKAKMAADPIPIKLSYSTVSGLRFLITDFFDHCRVSVNYNI